jgi:hypothetical protein
MSRLTARAASQSPAADAKKTVFESEKMDDRFAIRG